jgi:hypothetical protein
MSRIQKGRLTGRFVDAMRGVLESASDASPRLRGTLMSGAIKVPTSKLKGTLMSGATKVPTSKLRGTLLSTSLVPDTSPQIPFYDSERYFSANPNRPYRRRTQPPEFIGTPPRRNPERGQWDQRKFGEGVPSLRNPRPQPLQLEPLQFGPQPLQFDTITERELPFMRFPIQTRRKRLLAPRPNTGYIRSNAPRPSSEMESKMSQWQKELKKPMLKSVSTSMAKRATIQKGRLRGQFIDLVREMIGSAKKPKVPSGVLSGLKRPRMEIEPSRFSYKVPSINRNGFPSTPSSPYIVSNEGPLLTFRAKDDVKPKSYRYKTQPRLYSFASLEPKRLVAPSGRQRFPQKPSSEMESKLSYRQSLKNSAPRNTSKSMLKSKHSNKYL